MNAAFQIIRGGVAPLDLATVQTGDGGKCYMALLANWGFAADADIESEKFRKIGETRFLLGELKLTSRVCTPDCIVLNPMFESKGYLLAYSNA